MIKATKRYIRSQLRSRYIAGPELSDAIAISRRLAQKGWSSTICPWEGLDDPPAWVAQNYERALHAIKAAELDCYLSIKVPAMNYDLGRMKHLMSTAQDFGIRLHFDSLSPDTAERSLKLFEQCLTTYDNLGFTLPARWRRSLDDARHLREFSVPLRVVKGQWGDPHHHELDPRVQFLKIMELLAGRTAPVAVATHDSKLAQRAIQRLQADGTPCELEQLFGLPLHTIRAGQELGVNIRVYVPYGYAWLPYSLNQVRKRPIILLWMARDILGGTTKRILA